MNDLYAKDPPKGGFFVSEGKRVQFKRLSNNFSNKTRTLQEVLEDKGRGYCVAEVEYKGLFFAVPLRTALPHKNGKAIKIGGARTAFITDQIDDPQRGVCFRGLHYEKALLLDDKETDLTGHYPLPNSNQRTVLNDNEYKIKKEFTKYIDTYIRAHKRNLHFKNSFFRSTLRNYHNQLNIE